MDVILLEDIDNKGKKNAIISVATGYANYLIANNRALPCSIENLNKRQNDLKKQKEEENRLKEEAFSLSQKLISIKDYNISVESTPKGTLKRSITKEDVIEIIRNKTGIILDKTNLKMNVIKTFGIHKIGIDLHKNIKCVINLNIEVKE